MDRQFNLQLFAEDVVDVETLKQQGFTDDDLNGFVDQPDSEPEPEPAPTPQPDNNHESLPEPEPEPAPDSDKVSTHVPYSRFKEVNEKNKALQAELEALKQAPAPPPARQAAPQQAVNIDEAISNKADFIVRQKLGIAGDIDDLAIEEPAKYRQYMKDVAKVEIQLENQLSAYMQVTQRNDGFIAEISSMQNAQTVVAFAEKELDELPAREARPLEAAKNRLIAKQATAEDITLLRGFMQKCGEKLNQINAVPADPPNNTAPVSSKLDKANDLPKSDKLASGVKTTGWGEAEIIAAINENRIDDIPKDILKQIDPKLV